LNEEAGKLFMENYQEYFKHAKLLTDLYAQPRDKSGFNLKATPNVRESTNA
jgi:hypothetical protein